MSVRDCLFDILEETCKHKTHLPSYLLDMEEIMSSYDLNDDNLRTLAYGSTNETTLKQNYDISVSRLQEYRAELIRKSVIYKVETRRFLDKAMHRNKNETRVRFDGGDTDSAASGSVNGDSVDDMDMDGMNEEKGGDGDNELGSSQHPFSLYEDDDNGSDEEDEFFELEEKTKWHKISGNIPKDYTKEITLLTRSYNPDLEDLDRLARESKLEDEKDVDDNSTATGLGTRSTRGSSASSKRKFEDKFKPSNVKSINMDGPVLSIPFKPAFWKQYDAQSAGQMEVNNIRADALKRRHQSTAVVKGFDAATMEEIIGASQESKKDDSAGRKASQEALQSGDQILFKDLLKSMQIFYHLDDESIASFERECEVVEFYEQEEIIKVGSNVGTAYIVVHGIITLHRENSVITAQKDIAGTLTRGDFFGAILPTSQVWKANNSYVATVENTVAFSCSQEIFRKYAYKKNDFMTSKEIALSLTGANPLLDTYLKSQGTIQGNRSITSDEVSLISHIEQFLEFQLLFTDENVNLSYTQDSISAAMKTGGANLQSLGYSSTAENSEAGSVGGDSKGGNDSDNERGGAMIGRPSLFGGGGDTDERQLATPDDTSADTSENRTRPALFGIMNNTDNQSIDTYSMSMSTDMTSVLVTNTSTNIKAGINKERVKRQSINMLSQGHGFGARRGLSTLGRQSLFSRDFHAVVTNKGNAKTGTFLNNNSDSEEDSDEEGENMHLIDPRSNYNFTTMQQRSLNKKKTLMLNMLGAATPELDLSESLDIMMKLTKEFFNVDRIGIFIVDKVRGTMMLHMSQVDRQSNPGAGIIEVPLKGIGGHVARTGTLVNLADVYEDARFDPAMDARTGYRTRAMIAVPAMDRSANSNVLGVLQLINPSKQFDPEETLTKKNLKNGLKDDASSAVGDGTVNNTLNEIDDNNSLVKGIGAGGSITGKSLLGDNDETNLLELDSEGDEEDQDTVFTKEDEVLAVIVGQQIGAILDSHMHQAATSFSIPTSTIRRPLELKLQQLRFCMSNFEKKNDAKRLPSSVMCAASIYHGVVKLGETQWTTKAIQSIVEDSNTPGLLQSGEDVDNVVTWDINQLIMFPDVWVRNLPLASRLILQFYGANDKSPIGYCGICLFNFGREFMSGRREITLWEGECTNFINTADNDGRGSFLSRRHEEGIFGPKASSSDALSLKNNNVYSVKKDTSGETDMFGFNKVKAINVIRKAVLVEFKDYEHSVVHESAPIKNIRGKDKQEEKKAIEDNEDENFIDDTASEYARKQQLALMSPQERELSKYKETLNAKEIARFEELGAIGAGLSSVMTTDLQDDDAQLIWTIRKALISRPNYIPIAMLSTAWHKSESVYEAYRLLDSWDVPKITSNLKSSTMKSSLASLLLVNEAKGFGTQHMHPDLHLQVIVMQLITYVFPDPKVRCYSMVQLCKCLSHADVMGMLLVLFQSTRYERYMDNALYRFLMRRALENLCDIGWPLYWFLKDDYHFPKYSARNSVLATLLKRSVGDRFRTSLGHAEFIHNELSKVTHFVLHPDRNKRESKEALMVQLLQHVTLPTAFDNPTNPRYRCSSLSIKECNIIKTFPTKTLRYVFACDVANSHRDNTMRGEEDKAVHRLLDHQNNYKSRNGVLNRCVVWNKVGVDATLERVALQMITSMGSICHKYKQDVPFVTYNVITSTFPDFSGRMSTHHLEEKKTMSDLARANAKNVNTATFSKSERPDLTVKPLFIRSTLFEVPMQAKSMQDITVTHAAYNDITLVEKTSTFSSMLGLGTKQKAKEYSAFENREFADDMIDSWLCMSNVETVNKSDHYPLIVPAVQKSDSDNAGFTNSIGSQVSFHLNPSGTTFEKYNKRHPVRRKGILGFKSVARKNKLTGEITDEFVPNPMQYQWRTRFARSLANFYVQAYILGISGRDMNNVMFLPTGEIFHFELNFLNLQELYTINSDGVMGLHHIDKKKLAAVLKKEREHIPLLCCWMRVLGGSRDNTPLFTYFKNWVWKIYQIMRNNCGYLVTVMRGSLSSIPAFGEEEISMVLAAFMNRLKSTINDEDAKTALIADMRQDIAFYSQTHGPDSYPAAKRMIEDMSTSQHF